jgi:hypothetical protein
VWLWFLTMGVVFGFVAVVHGGGLIAPRVAFRLRVTRLRKALPRAASINHEKMLVAKAHLRWPGALVLLDGFASDVVVPAHKRSSRMTLQFGANMPTPIRNLTCNEGGIGGVLSFEREPFQVWVPWEAVYAIGQKPGWSWTRHLSSKSRARVSAAYYGRALRCPGCGRPPLGDRWRCDGCSAAVDPFLNDAPCQKCAHNIADGIQCLGCHVRFTLDEWRIGAQIPEAST